MTCVLFVIHILSVYSAFLGCLHRLQNKESGSEPPKHRKLRSEVRNNRVSSDSVWCVCIVLVCPMNGVKGSSTQGE